MPDDRTEAERAGAIALHYGKAAVALAVAGGSRAAIATAIKNFLAWTELAEKSAAGFDGSQNFTRI